MLRKSVAHSHLADRVDDNNAGEHEKKENADDSDKGMDERDCDIDDSLGGSNDVEVEQPPTPTRSNIGGLTTHY